MVRSKPGDEDQYRCQLCQYGLECKRKVCGFAHRLDELLPPNEQSIELPGVWRNGVHRWYGQRVGETVLKRILDCYMLTPPRERPVWATGCLWFYNRLPSSISIAELPYDFGVFQDLLVVKMHRASKDWPFSWAPGLWKRMGKNKVDVNSMNLLRVPTTPPMNARGIVITSPSSDSEFMSAQFRIGLKSERYSPPSKPSPRSSDSESLSAPHGIMLKSKRYSSSSNPCSSDSARSPETCLVPLGQEVSDDDLPGVAKVFEQVGNTKVSSEESDTYSSGSETVGISQHEVLKQRVMTVCEENVPKSEVFEEKQLIVGKCKEEPEVDHPRGKHPVYIHASCDATLAMGSVVCGNGKAVSSSSSSTSSSSRSRSMRGVAPSVSSSILADV